MRGGKGKSGLLPSSLRIISSCLKTVSSNAGTVASTVRSAGASVAASIAVSPEDVRDQSEVFAVAFAVLATGAIILTLNVLLLGGNIIFFQSLSLLGYCLFPLDVGALICMVGNNVVIKMIVVSITLGCSSWAAYPFMSAAVSPQRKALALYPVFLMYLSVGCLIIAID